MNVLGVIPARYGSSRFPGKPLAFISGKSMIQRVYEQVRKSKYLSNVVVATDDQRIYDHVLSFNGKVMMTSQEHPNGTSRVLEVVESLENGLGNETLDAVINIQGDEPFIHPEQIDLLISAFEEQTTQIATLCKKINDTDALFDPNTVKLVKDKNDFALYFSRLPIPFGRGLDKEDWVSSHNFWKHIGIYGYRPQVLKTIVQLKTSPLEQMEKLEQLRWLENGMTIKVKETTLESPSVDTPEDLEKILKSFGKT